MKSILKDSAYEETKKLIKDTYLNNHATDEIKNKLLNLYNELTIDNTDYICDQTKNLITSVKQITKEIRISNDTLLSIL